MTPQTVTSALQVAVIEYFAGERREMLAMIAGALVLSTGALWLFLAARTGFALAFMTTVMIFAALMSAGTVSLMLRDADSSRVLSCALQNGNYVSAITGEEERIHVVLSKYRYYRYGAAAIGVLAIAGFLTVNRGWVHGVAAGLLFLVPSQVIIDHFSERRAHLYLRQLKNYSVVQPIRRTL